MCCEKMVEAHMFCEEERETCRASMLAVSALASSCQRPLLVPAPHPIPMSEEPLYGGSRPLAMTWKRFQGTLSGKEFQFEKFWK